MKFEKRRGCGGGKTLFKGFSLPRKTKVNSLSECRKEIDEIDSRLLELLERRIRVAESVARYKIENDMKVFDEGRERAVLEDLIKCFNS